MKKRSHLNLLLVSLLFLTACQPKADAPVEQVSVAKTEQSAPETVASDKSIGLDGSEVDNSEGAGLSEVEEEQRSSSSVKEGDALAVTGTSAIFNGFYYTVQGKYGELIVVNKKHALSPHYGYGEDSTALASFQNLLAAMKAEGFAVSDAYSGFRSYETQAGLYQNYVARDGQAAADRYSARPGHSEHQTGLAFDIIDSNGNLLEEPVASQWLLNNAHHYGFIVRYLPGKEAITGYMAEPWHIRYIGAEAADIATSGLTLEEYFNIPGGDYD